MHLGSEGLSLVMRRVGWVVAFLSWLGCGAIAAASTTTDQARLVTTFETAPGLLVGTVSKVESVLYGGWIATIDVERVLRGEKVEQVEVAWEEPVPALPSRIESGRRILVATEPMSTASIWKKRVPDPARRARLLSIASKATAFVERPKASELSDLEHYLALDRDARRGDAGIVYLAALSAGAEPKLAIAALATLDAVPNLSVRLSDVSAVHLCNAILRQGRMPEATPGTAESDVSDAALALVERRRPRALRPVVESRIAQRQPNVPAVLYAALGAIDGRIPDDIALALLASASIEHRIAAARWASGEKGRQRIRYLLRGDPEPAVRAAAVQRLLQLEAERGLDDAVRTLDDPSPEVRLAAMRSIAKIDPEAISELEYIVESGTEEGQRSAIVTLSMMGKEAHQLLLQISEQHPDESLRTLAGIAVGKPLGHVH